MPCNAWGSGWVQPCNEATTRTRPSSPLRLFLLAISAACRFSRPVVCSGSFLTAPKRGERRVDNPRSPTRTRSPVWSGSVERGWTWSPATRKDTPCRCVSSSPCTIISPSATSATSSRPPIATVYGPFPRPVRAIPRSCNFCSHTSGPLLEMARRPPARVNRAFAWPWLERPGGNLSAAWLFYEPILPMIPSLRPVHRPGLLPTRTYLETLFGGRVRGAWLAERVWEQNLVADLTEASVEYTVLDDFHFKQAGLDDAQLTGYHLTEYDGREPSARLPSSASGCGYHSSPSATPEETVAYLGEVGRPSHLDRRRRLRRRWRQKAPARDPLATRYTNGWPQCVVDALGVRPSPDSASAPSLRSAGRDAPRAGLNLPPRLQLPRDDRVGLADGPADRIPLPPGRNWSMTTRRAPHRALSCAAAPGRNFQGEVPFVTGNGWPAWFCPVSRATAPRRSILGHGQSAARQELYRAQCNCFLVARHLRRPSTSPTCARRSTATCSPPTTPCSPPSRALLGWIEADCRRLDLDGPTRSLSAERPPGRLPVGRPAAVRCTNSTCVLGPVSILLVTLPRRPEA